MATFSLRKGQMTQFALIVGSPNPGIQDFSLRYITTAVRLGGAVQAAITYIGK
jgi:hypothetical protein